MNRNSESISYYEKVIGLNDCHAKALNNLGDLKQKSGDQRSAMELYGRSARCDPRFASPRYNLANLYRDQGDLELAKQYYEETLRLNKEHYRSAHNLAIIYLYEVKRDATHKDIKLAKAEELVRLSISLRPQDALNHYTMAKILTLAGKKQEALDELKEVIRLGNDSWKSKARDLELKIQKEDDQVL
jgi:tetratricopeptide (TPR) repeat protein